MGLLASDGMGDEEEGNRREGDRRKGEHSLTPKVSTLNCVDGRVGYVTWEGGVRESGGEQGTLDQV